jgi:putative exosortase-associated protein (TIGR04073 family)
MKNLFTVAVVAAMIFSFASPIYADGPMTKLQRGATNLVVSPLEVPSAVWSFWENGNVLDILTGGTWGVLLGAFNFAKRAVVGAYEIVTFPFPMPAEYKPIIDAPELFS